MNRALLSLFVVLLISIPSLQALRAAQATQGRPVPITPMGPKLPGPRTSFRTTCGIWDQLRVVVRDRDAWLDVWKRIHRFDPNRGPYPEPPPLPEIDFSREMLIVAAMGARPTSGYAIIIEGAYAYDRNYRLEVVVRSVENRNCGAFQVMTAPVDIVRLPKTERAVVFREVEVVPDCK
jgi:hypothetical protein